MNTMTKVGYFCGAPVMQGEKKKRKYVKHGRDFTVSLFREMCGDVSGFLAVCEAPDIVAQGETEDEAWEQWKKTVESHVRVSRKFGQKPFMVGNQA